MLNLYQVYLFFMKNLNLRTKLIFSICLGLTILLVLGTYVFIRHGISGEDHEKSAFVLIPVWIAAIIPFMIAKKKPWKWGEAGKQRKLLKLLLIGTVVLVVFTAFFVFS